MCVRAPVCVCVRARWFFLSDPILLQLLVIVAGHHPASFSPQGSNDTVKEGGGGDGGTFVENFETDGGECCQSIRRVRLQTFGCEETSPSCGQVMKCNCYIWNERAAAVWSSVT